MNEPSDLYGLPLDRFVAQRGALTKALRAEGRRDEAARAAALRKPSVGAWTVNQLVRTQRRPVAALFDAGDALQRAQSDLLAGAGDARALREATQRERLAVAELTQLAEGLLSSEGREPTQATLDRVSETLHAAALDPDARAEARDGCLERDLRWIGFGASGPVGSPPASRRGPRREPAEREQAGRERTKREQAERERAERERAEQLKSARKAEAAARRLAERAARELQDARARRDRAAASLGDAEDALAAARAQAEETALAHEHAQQALARI